MRFSEACVLSGNVKKLADFYKTVLGIDNGSDDNVSQLLIDGDVRLRIFDDNREKTNNNTNMCLVFDCEDVDTEYERLKELMGRKLHFIEKPHDSRFGYRSMSFYDIDGNRVYFHSGERTLRV